MKWFGSQSIVWLCLVGTLFSSVRLFTNTDLNRLADVLHQMSTELVKKPDPFDQLKQSLGVLPEKFVFDKVAFRKAADEYAQSILGESYSFDAQETTGNCISVTLKDVNASGTERLTGDGLAAEIESAFVLGEGKDEQKKRLKENVPYKIHLMPRCKLGEEFSEQVFGKQELYLKTDINEARGVLLALIKLLVENKDVREAVWKFKFVKNLSVDKAEYHYPVFVIYPYAGKKYAQAIIDGLCKNVVFAGQEGVWTYEKPRFNAPLDQAKYPGIFYAMGNGSTKANQENLKWKLGELYDEQSGYVFFNSTFVNLVDGFTLKVPDLPHD